MASPLGGPQGPGTLVSLLQAARGGSPGALGDLLEACRDYLSLLANRELSIDMQAKGGGSDLVQDTFLEAHRDFASFQGETESELLAWLRQAFAHNLANFRRHYLAHKRDVRRETALEKPDLPGALDVGEAADQSTPSAHAVREEESQALEQALARLPDHYRQILALRHHEQWSFEEIGRVLGRSPGAVRKLWARAVEHLQKELEPPDDLA